MALSGCIWAEQTIRVSYHSWIGYESLFLASQFGKLPAGASLHRLESANASLDLLRGGEVDAAALTVDEVMRARIGDGLDLVIVMVFDVSSGGDALLVNDEIESLGELAERRVGVELGGVGEFLLDQILDRAGVARADIDLVDRPFDQHRDLWWSGQVDALVTFEPVASQLESGGARRLIDSRSFPDTIFDVLAVRRDRLPRVDRILPELIEAHFCGVRQIRSNPTDAIHRIAGVQGVSEEVVRISMGGVLLPDLAANHRYLSAGSRLSDTLRALHARLSAAEAAELPEGRLDWVTPAYLPEARGA